MSTWSQSEEIMVPLTACSPSHELQRVGLEWWSKLGFMMWGLLSATDLLLCRVYVVLLRRLIKWLLLCLCRFIDFTWWTTFILGSWILLNPLPLGSTLLHSKALYSIQFYSIPLYYILFILSILLRHILFSRIPLLYSILFYFNPTYFEPWEV